MNDDSRSALQDKVHVGVTESGRQTLERLKGDYFDTERAAFQAAIALAIRLGLEPSGEAGYETKWSVGTISEILDFLRWYVPTETPARYAERIGDAGLAYVASKIDIGRSVSEIFDASDRRPGVE